MKTTYCTPQDRHGYRDGVKMQFQYQRNQLMSREWPSANNSDIQEWGIRLKKRGDQVYETQKLTTEINNTVENMVVEVDEEQQLPFPFPKPNLLRMNSQTSCQGRLRYLISTT